MDSIDHQLSSIAASLMSQISDLVKKIDSHHDRVTDLEKRIENSIVSAIREIAKIVDSLSHQKQANLTQQRQIHIQSTSCSEKVQVFIPESE